MAGTEHNPIDRIRHCVKTKKNFVLSGWAGSGKTRTLVESMDLIYEDNPRYKIACITFTNVAADEIKERTFGKDYNLRASTIHDFLWDNIKNYQKNLKKVPVDLVSEGKISYKGKESLTIEWFNDKSIDYREWRKIENGVISHNEVLLMANRLFAEFSLLRKIMCDKYDYILIDEYQDTEEQVIQIFLDYLQNETRPTTIGLFGDSMQSIYENGIGNLASYIGNGTVVEIQKDDNWRCAKSVIQLINKIRNDGLTQRPVNNNPEGRVVFLYCNQDGVSTKDIIKHDVFRDFDFDSPSSNKELYLTHKLIANQLGFENLLNSYKYRENLTGDNPDDLISH